MRRPHVIIERDAKALTSLLPEIQSLADSQKDALGFLPAKAFEEAIGRGRLLAATVDNNGSRNFAGYLLHSGVFPNAKIQQIAATCTFRKVGVASALIKALVSELERVGFMSIRADVASDLSSALAFYANNGFEAVFERAGGKTRGRMIIVHTRQLETDNLFTLAVPQPTPLADLWLHRSRGEAPVFAFDLNVYFDLVRQRNQSENARRLFGEALGHTIRLAVANEFVVELRRTSNRLSADPVLQMALQLPRLPKPDASLLDQVADQIYDIVFVKRNAKGAGTEQAKSDAKHLAHATISRASAFITRDGPILTARNELLTTFGIDVATVEEVLDLLPESLNSNTVTLRGDGFELGQIDNLQLAAHLVDAGVQAHIVSEFTRNESSTEFTLSQAIRSDGRIVAIGSVRVPKCVEPTARMIVHVRQEHRDAELFADHFLSALIRIASENAPVLIELIHLPGQSVINRSAAARGFHRRANSQAFSKVAVGRPCSARTWSIVSRQMRRRTGLILPETLPAVAAGGDIEIGTVNGAVARIKAVTLENLLGPTLFVWPGRDGVIVPITRAYADELLGTASQRNLAFITNRDAAFLSVRGYVNAPRTAKQMRVGAPIIFYESKRKGGRGAAVAVARIINSIVVSKSQLDPKSDKRLVIDSVDNLSATDDVLLTTFDNLMAFPNPVTFNKLKKLDAVGRTNLVSAVSLSSEQIDSILTCGWSSGKIQ